MTQQFADKQSPRNKYVFWNYFHKITFFELCYLFRLSSSFLREISISQRLQNTRNLRGNSKKTRKLEENKLIFNVPSINGKRNRKIIRMFF